VIGEVFVIPEILKVEVMREPMPSWLGSWGEGFIESRMAVCKGKI
jgi:hypothetical protein